MSFGIGFANWQELGIDPISLGQPKLWITAYDPTYLINSGGTSPALSGNVISGMTRYTDKLFNPNQTSTTNRAIYNISSEKGYIDWSISGGQSEGQYSVGTTTDFSFLHQNGSKFTIYWVFKNTPNENGSLSKIFASTTQSTGNRGFIHYISNSTDTRFIRIGVRNDTGGQEAVSYGSNFQYNRTQDIPLLLYSFRCDLSVALSATSIYGYLNGVLDNTAPKSFNCAGTAASFTTMRIGNRALADGKFMGRVGEYIIFNGLHDEATHLKICNYLKDKWRIS